MADIKLLSGHYVALVHAWRGHGAFVAGIARLCRSIVEQYDYVGARHRNFPTGAAPEQIRAEAGGAGTDIGVYALFRHTPPRIVRCARPDRPQLGEDSVADLVWSAGLCTGV